jgi:hypothetical protein
MLRPEVAWAGRVWALPFLTALCPSERYPQPRGQRHHPLPEWAGHLRGLIQRWLPAREVVVGAESSSAVSELLAQVKAPAGGSLLTRLRSSPPIPVKRSGGGRGTPPGLGFGG